jgi:type II secretion system protein J
MGQIQLGQCGRTQYFDPETGAAMRIPSRKGFTLLELLVAVAILALVISIAFAASITVISGVKKASTDIEHKQKHQHALYQLTRQLACMHPLTLSNSRPASKKNDIPALQNAFASEDHLQNKTTFSFITTYSIFSRNTSGLIYASYIFDHTNQQFSVTENLYVPSQGIIENTTTSEILIFDVSRLKLEFSGGEKWLEKWDLKKENALPRAIKLTLNSDSGHQDRIRRITAPVVCSKLSPISIEVSSGGNKL